MDVVSETQCDWYIVKSLMIWYFFNKFVDQSQMNNQSTPTMYFEPREDDIEVAQEPIVERVSVIIVVNRAWIIDNLF